MNTKIILSSVMVALILNLFFGCGSTKTTSEQIHQLPQSQPLTQTSVSAGESTVTEDLNETQTPVANTKPIKCKALPQTGQTTVYADFDDGYYQKGANADPRFIRDDTKEVVTDKVTGLMWQDNDDAKTITKKQPDALAYCRKLKLSGFADWRLPTIYELVYITDKGRTDPAISPLFENVSSDNNVYWSSTPDGHIKGNSWVIEMRYGVDSSNQNSLKHAVRCVRNNK